MLPDIASVRISTVHAFIPSWRTFPVTKFQPNPLPHDDAAMSQEPGSSLSISGYIQTAEHVERHSQRDHSGVREWRLPLPMSKTCIDSTSSPLPTQCPLRHRPLTQMILALRLRSQVRWSGRLPRKRSCEMMQHYVRLLGKGLGQ